MKISFKVNIKRFIILLTGAMVGWFLWGRVLQHFSEWASPLAGLMAFGGFMLYMGSVLNGWFMERLLRHYWRTQGYHEDAAHEQVKQMEQCFRRASIGDLSKG